VAFGAHDPEQTPPTHAWLVHGAPLCHEPFPSQVWTTWPLHCLAPGLHVPEHVPPLQTLVHAVPFTQVPVGSHVSGTRPLHFLAPGAQTPEQAPLTHAWFAHATAVPYWPLASQVCTPLPEH
jgi:hypothetical protein